VAACDGVTAANNLVDTPPVERQSGGRHGGATRLTAEGREVYALVKASIVILAHRDDGYRTGARNRLCGTVSRLVHGPVN
jgi:molybdate transport repressor ModE-like protein